MARKTSFPQRAQRRLLDRTLVRSLVPIAVWTLATAIAAAAPADGGDGDQPPWAFRPRQRAAPPAAGVDHPIDAFLEAARQAAGLAAAPAAERLALIRRLSFDLTGLPPEPGEVDRFLADDAPDAWERLVDRFLAAPGFAERQARHWLDVVRYGDSDGFAIDSERPTLWRYRDYIIRAFDDDRPFDDVIREHIAGDELDDELDDEAGAVAIGFYRLGPWEADNMVAAARRQDYLNEITHAVGAAFLGLTLGCARCHDHKYDPISQRDFYRLQAFLTPLRMATPPAPWSDGELTPGVVARKEAAEAELARRREALAAHRATLRDKLAAPAAAPSGEASAAVGDAEIDAAINKAIDAALGKDAPFDAEEKKRHAELKKALDEFKEHERFAAVACAVSLEGDDAKPPPTRVLLGGSFATPGDEVAPGFLGSVAAWDDDCFRAIGKAAEKGSGRRRVLADWLASGDNPLTPRVLANRVWQQLLGAGIVATANDFGANGSGASHEALLDFLAGELVGAGWRLKPLYRLIATSSAYRMSVRHADAAAAQRIDPGNRLLWRSHHRRLQAEAIRDALLAAAGALDGERGGPGFYEKLPEELGRNFPFFAWDPSSADQQRRRSIYMFQRRNLVHPFIEAFDAADMTEPCERRGVSVTTPQVFALFNGEFAHDMAARLARRVEREAAPRSRDRIDLAFRLAFGRPPSEREAARCESFLAGDALAEALADATAGNAANSGVDRLAELCLVLFNANEFIYLE